MFLSPSSLTYVDNYGSMYLAAFEFVITKLVSCTAQGFLSYAK